MTHAIITFDAHSPRASKLKVIAGFDGEDAAKLYAQQNRAARFLRRGAEYVSGDVFVCEVIALDDFLEKAGSTRADFDKALAEHREQQAEAERQRIADQEARHQAILEEQRQAEIAQLAAEKEAEHQADLRAKFRKEAEAEINKTRKKTSE
jgi:hypothetical protein